MDASSQPILEISHYQKRYGSTVAVHDLSLVVGAGDIYGFIGHNGAGKTTLIRSIAGVHPIDGGCIRVNGIDVASDPVAAKRAIAYVPDNPDVYEFMTGIQYLTFIADIFGVERTVRQQRIEALAERLELTPFLANSIGSYSHGMRQKLVVIGALVHEPKLLVLDEPFVGLDPLASHELKTILHEFAARKNAVFFSSHVLEVVEKLCNKVAVIRRGELIAAGDTDEVRGNASLEDVFLELSDMDADGGANAANRSAAGTDAARGSSAVRSRGDNDHA